VHKYLGDLAAEVQVRRSACQQQHDSRRPRNLNVRDAVLLGEDGVWQVSGFNAGNEQNCDVYAGSSLCNEVMVLHGNGESFQKIHVPTVEKNESSSQVQDLLMDVTPVSMGLETCLRDSGPGKRSVHEQVHVGGFARNPKVFSRIHECFQRKELCGPISFDEVVDDNEVLMKIHDHAVLNSEGSLQVQDLLLVDVTSLSMGLDFKKIQAHTVLKSEGSAQVQDMLLMEVTPVSKGLKSCLRDNGLGKRSEHEEVHVGGPTRNPEEQVRTQEFCNGKEPCGTNNPGEAYGDSHKSESLGPQCGDLDEALWNLFAVEVADDALWGSLQCIAT